MKPNATNLTSEKREIYEVQNVPEQVQYLMDLVGLVDRHFRKQRRPAFYARTLAIKESTLNQYSRIILRKTIYDLIQEKLHHEAVKLLLTTDWPIKRISYEIGSKDPCYFNRCFKKLTGLSPGKFRMHWSKKSYLNYLDHLQINNI